MRYMIKQKMLSLGDSFDIKDDDGQSSFKVKGKLLSLRDKMILTDVDGKEVATITRKLISLQPTFLIHRHNKLEARLWKKRTLIRQKFGFDGPAMKGVTLQGNIWDSEYTFKRKGKSLAKVSRKFWSLSDTYGVHILDDDADIVMVMASAIALDMLRDEEAQG